MRYTDPQSAVPEQLQRANTIRDAIAGLLLVIGVLLPWNVYFGITIAGTTGWVLALVLAATLLSLAAAALSHLGPTGIRLPDTDLTALNRRRLMLNIPFFIVAAGFVVFTLVQSVRVGGTPAIPPGIGPGVWFGVAGALLSAAPVITGADHDRWGHKVCRTIAIGSVLLAVAATLFNLYWRTRFVLPDIGDPDTGTQNAVVALTAVLYGIVALLPILVAARWLMSTDRAPRLATMLLAAAALVAGLFVWVFPVGRDLDAFHGIAQNTSTAGVGFEGYLAWVAVAAIVGSDTGRVVANRNASRIWRAAARKCLVLIAVCGAGSAVLRILDLMTSAVLELPSPPYNGTALMAFDVVLAVLAMWLFVNSSGKAAPSLVLTLLYGVLFALTVCRVILGVALIPRVPPLNPADINEVYGNMLAQQITSTFDVTLCVLALALLAIALLTGTQIATRPEPAVPQDQSAPTAVIETGRAAPTIAIPTGAASDAAATAKIHRSDPPPQAAPATDRIADVLAESTQRFGAGTTYGARPTPEPGGRDDSAQR